MLSGSKTVLFLFYFLSRALSRICYRHMGNYSKYLEMRILGDFLCHYMPWCHVSLS